MLFLRCTRVAQVGGFQLFSTYLESSSVFSLSTQRHCSSEFQPHIADLSHTMALASSRLLTPEVPISRLPNEIIWEIFTLNTYSENSPGEKTLDHIRHASQVCRRWREILLDSPAIWGKCVNLDLLDQTSDSWRDLVLERTGKSPLSITGGRIAGLHSTHGISRFLKILLDEHWARIQHLDLQMTMSKPSDYAFLWKACSRPTDTLKVFSIHAGYTETGSWNRPYDFQLFSAHAPSLVKLSFDSAAMEFSNIQAPSVFTQNMRYLRLTDYMEFKDTDLLTACMQMPFLEVLVLKIVELMTSPPSEITHRPSLPRLKLVDIESLNLDIYPAFLGRITPSVGCALRVSHSLDTWDTLSTEAKIQDLKCMCRVVERYAVSFFAHHDHVSDVADIQAVELEISQEYFGFIYGDSRENHFQIYVRLVEEDSIGQTLFSAMLLDSVSTFKLSTTPTALRLSGDSLLADGFLQHAESSLLRALHSMGSIVQLKTNHPVLSYLANTAKSDALFPLLEDVSVQLWCETGETIDTSILLFLKRRLNVTPLKILELTDCSDYTDCSVYVDRSDYSPPMDLSQLDEIKGLKVVWNTT